MGYQSKRYKYKIKFSYYANIVHKSLLENTEKIISNVKLTKEEIRKIIINKFEIYKKTLNEKFEKIEEIKCEKINNNTRKK